MKKTAASYISDLLNAYFVKNVLDYQEQYDETSLILSSLGEETGEEEDFQRYVFRDGSTLFLYPPFMREESQTPFLLKDCHPSFLENIEPRERIPFMEGIAMQVSRQPTCTRYSFSDLPNVLVYPLAWSADPAFKEDE